MLKQKEWIDVIVAKTGCSKKEAKIFYDCTFDYIREQISPEETVKISGFGVLKLRKTAAKEQINLVTGQAEIVPEHNVVVFKPYFDIDPKPEPIDIEFDEGELQEITANEETVIEEIVEVEDEEEAVAADEEVVEETPAPVEEPVEETKAEEVVEEPAEETPAEEVVEETPVEETPAPVEEPVEETPAEEVVEETTAPAEEAVEEAPVPVEETPVVETKAEEVWEDDGFTWIYEKESYNTLNIKKIIKMKTSLSDEDVMSSLKVVMDNMRKHDKTICEVREEKDTFDFIIYR